MLQQGVQLARDPSPGTFIYNLRKLLTKKTVRNCHKEAVRRKTVLTPGIKHSIKNILF
jgi:hypothetical protein